MSLLQNAHLIWMQTQLFGVYNMTLEMIVYNNGDAFLIFKYIRENNLEIDSIRLIENTSSSCNTMLVYVWCNETQKDELIRLKNIDENAK